MENHNFFEWFYLIKYLFFVILFYPVSYSRIQVADLKGKQRGDYQMEMSTGMLLNAKITNSVEETIQVQARDVPVTIESSVKITRR